MIGPDEKLARIHVEVGGIPAIALTDTGANFSLKSRAFFERIKIKYPSDNNDVIGMERTQLKVINDKNITIKRKSASQI